MTHDSKFDPDWPPRNESLVEAIEQALSDGSWAKYDGRWNQVIRARLQETFQCSDVLTCCSGTVAIEIALVACGVESGDEVILAGYDFPGNFRAIEAIGARPVLVDTICNGWIIDIDQIEKGIGDKTKAVLVSHLHGQIADMERLREMASRANLKVIEDACQVPGGDLQGRPLGSWGDVGVLSFGGSKLLTAGRGGAVLFHDPITMQRAKRYCERGNHAFPLSEIQAALLGPQLDTLHDCNRQRWKSVRRLRERLANDVDFNFGAANPEPSVPAFYKLPIMLPFDAGKENRRSEFLNTARVAGIGMGEGFRGFLRRPPRRCRKVGALPEAQRAVANTVLLHHPVLLESEPTLDALAEWLSRTWHQYLVSE